MLANYTNMNAIQTQASCTDAKSALELVGNLLTNGGFATAAYTQAITENFAEHGAYFVIAPGIALPHARPTGVKQSGISIVTLTSPVDFGNVANGPADLPIGLAATGNNDHLQLLAELVQMLSARWRYEQLVAAQTPDAVLKLLQA